MNAVIQFPIRSEWEKLKEVLHPLVYELLCKSGINLISKEQAISIDPNIPVNANGGYNYRENWIFLSIESIEYSKASLEEVALHELIHWTGGKERFNRPINGYLTRICYHTEEMIAQWGMYYMFSLLGLDMKVAEQRVHDYNYWYLHGNEELAKIEAQKAANYLYGMLNQERKVA